MSPFFLVSHSLSPSQPKPFLCRREAGEREKRKLARDDRLYDLSIVPTSALGFFFFFFFQLLLFLASTKERELFFGLSRKASPDKGRRGLPEDTMRRRIPYSRTPARQVLAN